MSLPIVYRYYSLLHRNILSFPSSTSSLSAAAKKEEIRIRNDILLHLVRLEEMPEERVPNK